MITKTQKHRDAATKTEPLHVAKYHVNPKHIGHITSILRNMYSDPKLAVMREYLANAIDAHRFGKITRPVDVTLPTAMQPELVIRDYGGGLNPEDAERLLYGYGSSGDHKRTSNEQIGGFGIGCKCALALTDAFTYTIWHGGMRQIWSCFLNENDEGVAQLVTYEADNAEPGIQVTVPTTGNTVDPIQFRNVLTSVVQYWPKHERPNVILRAGQNPIVWKEPLKGWITEDLAVTVDDVTTQVKLEVVQAETAPGAHLVMGNFLYKIESKQILSSLNRGTSQWHALWDRSVVHVPIGFVQLAPSREALQYSARTKTILQALYNSLFTDVFVDGFVAKAAKNVNEVLRMAQLLEEVKAPVPAKYKYVIESGSYSLLVPGGSCKTVLRVSYSLSYNGEATRERVEKGINADDVSLRIACQDQTILAVVRGTLPLDARVALARDTFVRWASTGNRSPIISGKHRVGVLVLEDPEDLQLPWLNDGSFPDKVIADENWTPTGAETSKWIKQAMEHSRYVPRSRSSGSNQYAQHARKFVALRSKSPAQGLPRSGWWEPCAAKDIKAGIYVPINEFRVQNASQGISESFHSINALIDHKLRSKLLPRAERILGVRTKDISSIEDVGPFSSLPQYIEACLKGALADGSVNREHLLRLLHQEIETNFVPSGRKWMAKQVYRLMINLGSRPELAGTVAGEAGVAWHDAVYAANEETCMWAQILPTALNAVPSMQSVDSEKFCKDYVTPFLIKTGVIPDSMRWYGWDLHWSEGTAVAPHMQELRKVMRMHPYLAHITRLHEGMERCGYDTTRVPRKNQATGKKLRHELEALLDTEALYTWVQATEKEKTRNEETE